MKKIFIILPLFIWGLTGFAQTIVMQNLNPMKPYQEKTQGENLKHYSHMFMGVGVVTPAGASTDDIYFGKSLTFDIGFRYRYRVSNFFHIGNDITYYRQVNSLNRNGMHKVYDGANHDRESIIQNEFRISPFIRFNLTPKRGNYLGTYIDLGGYVGWNFIPVFKVVDKGNSGNVKMKYTRSYDPNQNRYDYGITARVARNKYILFATYRLSDIMKKSEHPEIPRLSAGIQLGF